ncbi:hypothetical protein BDV59DRAFT_23774 [Aspergillus ambiguus]|uniref:ankyrin repeat domain-containing protein n=1 Tax=Aspergillus ambiguus TaxID=176160 RepID=UPI003CCD3289
MAEIVGCVSAGIGIAAFALQVASTIERLREIRHFNRSKAGVELYFLIQRLGLLRENLAILETFQGHGAVDLAISNGRLAYSSVDVILQQVTDRLDHLNHSRWKAARYSEGIKERIRQASERVDRIINDITLTCFLALTRNTPIGRPIETNAPVSSASVDAHLPENCHIEQSAAPRRLSISDSGSAGTSLVQSHRSPIPRPKALDCTVKHCHCSCHLTQSCSSRLWVLEYTPLSIFSGACSNQQCTATRYRWGLQFALTRYGIPFKIQTALEFVSGGGKYALRPALSIERVVKYTSPGFETLWRYQRGLMSLSKTKERFRELQKCDPSLKHHVHPGGRSYVQELLHYGPCRQSEQLELLRFFACELGMTLENQDQRFLIRCANWIGEGRHLHLLSTILEYGFDPGCIESPVYEDWPSTCNPNWISEEFTPDPFFIDYLAILVNASPGFAGSTALHDTVLLESPSSLTSFLSRSAMHTEKNFLGQTPLHLAVRDLEVVRLLVQSGHDLDSTDNQGVTPLMYAAAMGKTDVVQLLITQGADLYICDLKWERDFLAYATSRGHWQLVMDALGAIQAQYSPAVFQHFVSCALMRLVAHDTWIGEAWSIYFAKLVGFTANINIMFSDSVHGLANNNLLHYISNQGDAEVLVQKGFELFNQPNSEGETAIYSLAHVLNAKLTRFLIDQGTNVNVVDRRGNTVLFSLLGHLNSLHHRIWDTVDSITVFLREGLDIFSSDGCRCSCSPGGSSLPAAFDTTFLESMWSRTPSFVWALEFLSLIEELRGPEDLKVLLLAFIRRMKFDQSGLTHVCCHRGRGIEVKGFFQPEAIPEDDVDEILDEEREFVSELEEEMLSLTSETLECLRLKWMVMLRDRYRQVLEESRKRNKFKESCVPARVSPADSRLMACGPDRNRFHMRWTIRTTGTAYFTMLTSISARPYQTLWPSISFGWSISTAD